MDPTLTLSFVLCVLPFLEAALDRSSTCFLYPLLAVAMIIHYKAYPSTTLFFSACLSAFVLFISSSTFEAQCMVLLLYYLGSLIKCCDYKPSLRPLITLLAGLALKTASSYTTFALFCVLTLSTIGLWLDFVKDSKGQTTLLNEVLNNLSCGCAVQIVDSGEWSFFNKVLETDLLNTLNRTETEQKMETISKKVKEKSESVIGVLETTVEIEDLSPFQSTFIDNTFCKPSKAELFVTAKKVLWNGKEAYVYTVLDLTKAKMEAYKKEENLGRIRFSKALAHEFRTPINGTLNSLEQCKQLLNNTEHNKEVFENIEIALCSTNLLLNKYNDLLDFLLLETDQLRLEMSCFDIRGLIEEISNMVTIELKLKGIHYTTYVDESVPSIIYTDVNRMRQVILNLVENAIKYNVAEGYITISVSRQDDSLKIEVTDTGKGINSTKLNSIFRSEASTPNSRTLISLPTAYKLAKLLGGELTVDSKPSLGSTFCLLIQLQPIPSVYLMPALSKSPAEYNVEKECQDTPFIQHPLPSLRIRRLSLNTTKLHYMFRKLEREGASSDTGLKRFNYTPALQRRVFLKKPLLGHGINHEELHSNLSLSESLNTPEALFGGTRPNSTRRASAFKIETLVQNKLARSDGLNTERKERKRPIGQTFTNKIRCSLLTCHELETRGKLSETDIKNKEDKFYKKPKGSSLSCTSHDELCGKKEEAKQDLESLKKLVQAIAKRLKKYRCAECTDILVIDDNEFNRYLLVQLLSKYGFICRTATNGKEAVEMYQKACKCRCGGYKLLLMDLDMPEMNGLDATAQIRKQNKSVPIVAVTAFTSKRDLESCFNVGMNDHCSFSFSLTHNSG